MEENIQEQANDVETATEAPDPVAAKAKLRRRLIIGGVAALVVVAAVAGGFVHRANKLHEEAVAAKAQERAVAEALRAAEAAALGKQLKEAHQAIMDASPEQSTLPPPAAAIEADKEAAKPVPREAEREPKSTQVAVVPPKEGGDREKPAARRKTGSCDLTTGGQQADFGKVLERCLKEFNQLDGRKG